MDYRALRPNDCCKKPENYSTEIGITEQSFEKCKVCGCRHFVVKAESGKTGLVGVPLGGIQQNKN